MDWNGLEEWKDIPGFEGTYQFSNLDRVKSLSRPLLRPDKTWGVKKERILKPFKKTKKVREGYYKLFKGGKYVVVNTSEIKALFRTNLLPLPKSPLGSDNAVEVNR